MPTSFPQISQGSRSLSTLAKESVDPIVSAAALLVIAYSSGEPIAPRYSILAFLSILIAFPGKWPATTDARFLRDVGASWLIRSGLLLLLGLVTGVLHLYPPKVIVLWLAMTPIMIFAACMLLKKSVRTLRLAHAGSTKAVLVGANSLSRQLIQTVADDRLCPIEIIGVFDDRDPARVNDPAACAPRLGKMAGVAAYCRQHTVNRIYIALPMARHPRITRLMDELRDTTASIYFLPDMLCYDLIQARIDMQNGIPVLAICETPFLGLNGLVKRTSDIVLASLILVLSAPLMLAVAAGVKIGSPGPVLFRQHRYGVDGKDIVVYKFRSMTVCEDGPDVMQAKRGDPRVTAFGAFMRRTSLDELPQFINVLQGRMSIVGPRPHAIAHNEQYRKLIKSYMVRHKVKPGITGWAQVNGCRGETDSVDKMEKRIAYDLEYLRNWSLSLDLWIVLRTVLVVIKDRNAY